MLALGVRATEHGVESEVEEVGKPVLILNDPANVALSHHPLMLLDLTALRHRRTGGTYPNELVTFPSDTQKTAIQIDRMPQITTLEAALCVRDVLALEQDDLRRHSYVLAHDDIDRHLHVPAEALRGQLSGTLHERPSGNQSIFLVSVLDLPSNLPGPIRLETSQLRVSTNDAIDVQTHLGQPLTTLSRYLRFWFRGLSSLSGCGSLPQYCGLTGFTGATYSTAFWSMSLCHVRS